VKEDGSKFHKTSVRDFVHFLKGTNFVCGHNILQHDLRFIRKEIQEAGISLQNCIDTLYLSPLLFPAKPYHALLKDDKLQTDELNNPLNDAIKARDLFGDEVSAFRNLPEPRQQMFYLLLRNNEAFSPFFRFTGYSCTEADLPRLIRETYATVICNHAGVDRPIEANPIELAYCLALIGSYSDNAKTHSITPPWVLRNYPMVDQIMSLLRNKPCISGCPYCNSLLDIHKGLKHFFGFGSFKQFGGEPLQEKAVKAAVDNKSILVVFPTGGGKSITFQVPALMSGENARALTVVISPLQSLMKDQVDNLEKIGITDAVTINGLLDPIEKAKSFERVADGSASVLYISPESLRSKSIEHLILGRKIARFVIDEAHCFSSWGQDFRVDYLYIGDFIKSVQEKKKLDEAIPVSCFTATAKQKVIEEIRQYFMEKLSLELELITSKTSRTNLQYKVLEQGNDEEKYNTLRNLLDDKDGPTIIYVSRTYKAYVLAKRLNEDGYNARPFHGKMDANEKAANQNAFICGDVRIMVATSAFGMGVDKKDVGMVVHYEISDSLENYVQEAGRAGRDESLLADCYVLYNEEDLGKHFVLLNQTRLSIKEIRQVWKAIKEITRFRSTLSNSALEIAKKAGWDENVSEIETRVTTAVAALEEAGYLKRGQNMPRVFANSILAKNAGEAIDKIMASEKFTEKQKEKAVRIIKKLIASKSRKHTNEETAESRIDYISDHLGIVKEDVINIVNLLREENILADAKDLTAYIKTGENINKSLQIAETYCRLENFLLPYIEQEEKTLALKELNEQAELNGLGDTNTGKIKTLLNFWSIKNYIKRKNIEQTKNHIAIISLFPKSVLKEKLEKRHVLARFIIAYLYEKTDHNDLEANDKNMETFVEFSVHQIKSAYENSLTLFKLNINIEDIEDALFFLSRIEAMKIEGGFLVVYNRLSIERTETDNKKQYTKEDYQKLNQFYENKVQQIHIVGEYARKMLGDYRDALQFVEDYFQLNYSSFLRKYYPGSKADVLRLKMTPARFKQLFGELSPTQLKIINDNESKYIVVAAGPGSGKTRILVHKLASLLLMEDVKHEQLLMLTFSRAAATEFKKRLLQLIGNAANFVEIKTFHSYCFDLLGKVGTLEHAGSILKKTIDKIRSKEVEASRITKTVLVIDEAQDMSEDEFGLIKALIEQNEDMRVIAVGDDDQNIFEFRGSSSEFMAQMISVHQATKHELIENYRSKSNVVDFSNQFVALINKRLKKTPVVARQADAGMIRLFRYEGGNLVTPLVNDILSAGLTGTTCVLTKTNEEASQITGLLLRNGMKAKLIQTNDSFGLNNLLEVRYFLTQLRISEGLFTIGDEAWSSAKKSLGNEFRNSSKLDICNNIIRDFEVTHPRKYLSDLDVFLRESNLEDFISGNPDSILVATIHKAKGREFDNIFLMLDNFACVTDDSKRQLYVAMTRAKQNLSVHLNSGILDKLTTENLEIIQRNEIHQPPAEIAMHLTLKDVWLDYFINRQDIVSQLISGDLMIPDAEGCLSIKNQPVLKFSRSFQEQIEKMKTGRYELKGAKVNFIVYWQKEGSENEIKIVLPELWFEKVPGT